VSTQTGLSRMTVCRRTKRFGGSIPRADSKGGSACSTTRRGVEQPGDGTHLARPRSADPNDAQNLAA